LVLSKEIQTFSFPVLGCLPSSSHIQIVTKLLKENSSQWGATFHLTRFFAFKL